MFKYVVIPARILCLFDKRSLKQVHSQTTTEFHFRVTGIHTIVFALLTVNEIGRI